MRLRAGPNPLVSIRRIVPGWTRADPAVGNMRLRAGPNPLASIRRIAPGPVFSAPRRPRPTARPVGKARAAPPIETAGYDSDAEQFTVLGGATIDVVDSDEAEVDVFGESTMGNLHFTERAHSIPSRGSILGLDHPDDVLTMSYGDLKDRVQSLLGRLDVPPTTYPHGDPRRAIFCSRTLNLRSLSALGFDLDYTLVDYDVNAWEGRAYSYGMSTLKHEMGVPVDGLTFQPDLVIRGLILDTELGNVVKADRFGYVKRAMHGTRMMTPAEVRLRYGRQLVSLRNESRFVFLNTLFSISEAVMFAQLVDRLDSGAIPQQVCPQSYAALYKLVSKALFLAHVEGKLKAEIMQNPARFVHPDPDLPQVLLDMRQAGKTLLLITNSGFDYTEAVMQYAMQSYLPEGLTSWRELFDIIIINANKPDFFKGQQALHEVVTSDGLMRPARSLKRGGLYSGGSARQVEQSLGASGDSILYVGDHLYSDVQLAKKWESQWRTCLILRELEEEIDALAAGRQHHARLKDLLNKKEQVGDAFNNLRLAKQRSMAGQQRQEGPGPWMDEADGARVNEALAELLNIMDRLDAVIVPAIEADGAHFNVRWGHLTRAGVNDRSQLQRQVEKYADLYTSRVSNFGRYSPYFYFRSPSQAVVHDRPAADEKLKQRRAKKAGTTNGNSADSTTDGDGVGDHEPLHEALV